MSDPNVIGHVVEFCSDREVPLNEEGPVTTRCRLHLKLRNTLGQNKSIWVDGPSDLEGFFSLEGDTACR
jgi:hypothetical protein